MASSMKIASLAMLALSHSSTTTNVIVEDVNMSGMVCGWPFNQQQGIAVYQNSTEKHPLVAYAHGWTDGGKHLDADAQDFHELFLLLASAGYVVVAAKAPSGPYNGFPKIFAWCESEYKDQLQALRWARNSPTLRDHIDLDAPASVAGHSMGGLATLRSASDREAVKALNIGAAVAQHPATCWHQILCDSGEPLVPIMFTSGELDSLTPHVKFEYNRTSGVPKVFAEMKGVGHCDPSIKRYPASHNWAGPPHVENHYVLDWLNCFIKHNSTACSLAHCREPQSNIPTTSCVAEGLPTSARVVII